MSGGHAGQDGPGQVQPPRPEPLILTLGLIQPDQAGFDRLRATHFPPARNVLHAHVTLFHHLPGPMLDHVAAAIAGACARRAPFDVAVTGVRSLGRGVAFTLASPELAALRAGLARTWADWLTPQDRQGFRPHVTIQNKADPADARALLAQMQAGFTPFAVRADALLLWRYLGGPWQAVGRYPFAQTDV